MLIKIEESVLHQYPHAEIGYLVAQVQVKKNDTIVEQFKQNLLEHLERQGINATNFVSHPDIAIWREIYQKDFQVNPKTYRSSIEALVRRLVTGKGIWEICNVVDLYNCCSVVSLLPMGGYDLSKISGDIQIRYAHAGELFQGLGQREHIETSPHHVIYADIRRVICWLWNHKDSGETAIDETTREAIFFVDALKPQRVEAALKHLSENLKLIACHPLERGILNQASPQAYLRKSDE